MTEKLPARLVADLQAGLQGDPQVRNAVTASASQELPGAGTGRSELSSKCECVATLYHR
jgi:hypothetical protein